MVEQVKVAAAVAVPVKPVQQHAADSGSVKSTSTAVDSTKTGSADEVASKNSDEPEKGVDGIRTVRFAFSLSSTSTREPSVIKADLVAVLK